MLIKKIGLALLLLLLSPQQINAQTGNSRKDLSKKKRLLHKPANCSDFYLTLGAGLNANTDIAGISVDIPIKYFTSVEAGVGLGLWGIRGYGGYKHYFKRCQRGLALGGGLTYNNGRQDFVTKMQSVTDKKEQLGFRLYPQTNIFIAAYYYWGIGKKNNRIFAELGYSVPLAGQKYNQISGDQLSAGAGKELDFLCPGGPVIGFGYSFGITN
jgi:hypothetical protein